MGEFKETERVWFTYEDAHSDARLLFESMQQTSEGPAYLIAIGRGGWIPARILASHFDSEGIPTKSATVQANYVELGTPAEHAEINQGLDSLVINSLKNAVNKDRYTAWLIDGPYMAGVTARAAQEHVSEVTSGITPYIGVLHWVKFASCPDAPWRRNALQPPDAFGRLIDRELKPYIEYPWEYADLAAYNQASRSAEL